MRQRLKLELPLNLLYKFPTIEALVERIKLAEVDPTADFGASQLDDIRCERLCMISIGCHEWPFSHVRCTQPVMTSPLITCRADTEQPGEEADGADKTDIEAEVVLDEVGAARCPCCLGAIAWGGEGRGRIRRLGWDWIGLIFGFGFWFWFWVGLGFEHG
jgi:hypothetical protein